MQRLGGFFFSFCLVTSYKISVLKYYSHLYYRLGSFCFYIHDGGRDHLDWKRKPVMKELFFLQKNAVPGAETPAAVECR